VSVFRKRGLWCGVSDLGLSRASIIDYLEKVREAGFNLIIPCLKDGSGRPWWPSEQFPQLVPEELDGFDLPAVLSEESKKRGIEVHAWFFDFYDGGAGVERPDWCQRNARGRTTAEEDLRGEKFGVTWMCPAQRPGYTDQRLVPLYAEFAAKYDIEGVHHDYVRYPGDMAPDQYCFCDHCLRELPRWARYHSDAFPDEAFLHPMLDREYVEAHWEPSPRVLPADWDTRQRHEKARFLLEGSFFPGGRSDLDYFFYAYRVHWITEFNRECAAAVRAANPKTRISGAFFKNPIHSGRFIGQDWRGFSSYVDTCFPMNYRDHVPGTFPQYLELLKETIRDQMVWARDYDEYASGAAINFLFFEEDRGLQSLARCVREGRRGLAARFAGLVEASLQPADPHLFSDIRAWAGAGEPATLRDAFQLTSFRGDEFFPTGERTDVPPALVERLDQFAKHPPVSYWPKSKLESLVEAKAQAGAPGYVLFCAGHLDQFGLWDTAGEINRRI
jgi:hypothetical protein